MEEALLILLALTGLADSVYFTLVYYHLIEPDARWIPSFCQMKEKTCRTVLDSQYGRLFGLPNSFYGMLYYCWIIAASITSLILNRFPLYNLSLIISWGTVILSLYLAYALIYRLRIPCFLCFLAHGINLGIALLLSLISH